MLKLLTDDDSKLVDIKSHSSRHSEINSYRERERFLFFFQFAAMEFKSSLPFKSLLFKGVSLKSFKSPATLIFSTRLKIPKESNISFLKKCCFGIAEAFKIRGNCNQNCTKKVLILLMGPFEIFQPFKYSGKHNYVDYIHLLTKLHF